MLTVLVDINVDPVNAGVASTSMASGSHRLGDLYKIIPNLVIKESRIDLSRSSMVTRRKIHSQHGVSPRAVITLCFVQPRVFCTPRRGPLRKHRPGFFMTASVASVLQCRDIGLCDLVDDVTG